MKIGYYNTLKVNRFTPQGAYLLDDDFEEVLLPNKYCDDSVVEDAEIKIFLYKDSLDRPVATTQHPFAIADEFAALKVNDVTEIGAFLDWGLEKDLFVPHSQMFRPLAMGRTYVVRILVDDLTDRMIATTKLRSFFTDTDPEMKDGDAVTGLVYEIRENAILVVIDGKYSGMIQSSEFREPVDIGTTLKLFVKEIDDEGRIKTSLAPAGETARQGSRDVILEKLQVTADGFLPYHDKSDPDEIRREFGMSKKTFKKLVGNLLRSDKITISKNGITLKN